jgi:hypothetical protein
VNWRAAVGAGVIAGIGATGVELALWSAFTDALPQVFCRDARLAAAIVMGPEVLSPSYDGGARLLAVAALLHFTLSIGFGMLAAGIVEDRSVFASVLIGAAFGLVLYVVNMYGFTRMFPWFEVTRDWITATTHVAFGIIAASSYRTLARRRELVAR